MTVDFGTEKEIDSWMELIHIICFELPGLETLENINLHKQTVLKFMKERRAICVKDSEKIVRVLLFSKKHNMICCLAVLPMYRGRGIANQLLKTALEQLDRTETILVSTFCEGDPKGVAPRALYKKFGFVEDEFIEEFGYPHQRFLLKP